MVQEKIDKGKTEKEAKSSVRSSFTAKYKPIYVKAMKSGSTTDSNYVRNLLYATGLYGTVKDLDKDLEKWRKEDE